MTKTRKPKLPQIQIKQSSRYASLIVSILIVVLGLYGFNTGFIQIAGINDIPDPTPIVRPSPQPTSTPLPTIKPTKPALIPSTPKPTVIPKLIPSQPKSNINGSGVFNSVNAYRASKGLPGLDVSDELCRLATIRANFIAIDNHKRLKEEPGHPGFDEQLGFDKYSGRYIGENISFIGFKSTNNSSQGVVDWWKISPSHNELLLNTQVEGITATKGCVATALDNEGTISILLVGDK